MNSAGRFLLGLVSGVTFSCVASALWSDGDFAPRGRDAEDHKPALAWSPAAVKQTDVSRRPESAERVETAAPTRAPAAVSPIVTGSYAINGRVLDEDRRPIANVTVRADVSDWIPEAGEVGTAFWSLEYERHWIIDPTPGTRGEATSGDDGTFRIDGLFACDYAIEARAEGWAFEQVNGYAGEVPGGATIELLGRRVVSAAVSVVLPDGSAPRTAKLTVSEVVEPRGDETWRDWSWRSATPELRLVPGRYTVSAYISPSLARSIGLDGEWWSVPVPWTVARAGTDPVVVRLVRMRGVRGRVVLPEHWDLGSLVVLLTPIAADLVAPSDLKSLRDAAIARYRMGDRTAFQFIDGHTLPWGDTRGSVPSGRYAVSVALDLRPSEEVLFHRVVDVGDDVESCELTVPDRLPLGDDLVVHATGPGGVPVEDLEIRGKFDGRWEPDGRLATTMPVPGEYHFWLTALQRAALNDPHTRVTLFVESDRYGEIRVQVDPGQGRVDVRFLDPATLVLTADADRPDLAGRLQASVVRDDLGPYVLSRQAPFASREARLGPLQPGPYHLSVEVEDGPYAEGKLIVFDRVDLVSGENRRAVLLPSLHVLRVQRGGDALDDLWLRLAPEGGDQEHIWNLAREAELTDSVATFEDVPAGTYVLSCDGEEPVTVTLPGQNFVVYPPRR